MDYVSVIQIAKLGGGTGYVSEQLPGTCRVGPVCVGH